MDKTALIKRIQEIDGLSNEERSALLGLLRSHKKYGLVWEDKPENVEERLRDELPVFREVKDKYIPSDLEDAPNHIIIEGDNLEALTALSYTHERKIDVIYIDPPYNTGNKDFFYNDSYVDIEDSYRHSKWLSFMKRRLQLAKSLMKSNGILFISIGDDEICQLKVLCDEIFNYQCLGILPRIAKAGSKQGTFFRPTKDFVLVYCKDKAKISNFYTNEIQTHEYKLVDENNRRYRKAHSLFQASLDPLRGCVNQRYYIQAPDGTLILPPGNVHPSEKIDAAHIKPNSRIDKVWRWSYQAYLAKKEYIMFDKSSRSPLIDSEGNHTDWNVYEKKYEDEELTGDMDYNLPDDVIYGFHNSAATTYINSLGIDFSFSKPYELIKYLIEITNKNNDIVILDFFAGSGTTMDAVMKLNNSDEGKRTCILVTNNENDICESITYERNKRVINGFTTPKGVKVEGLKDNNLRYYRTDFIPRDRTQQNMRDLVNASTDLLCIKEDLYNEQNKFGRFRVNPRLMRYFSDGKKHMLVVYREEIVDQLATEIANLDFGKQKLKIYIFSPARYAFNDNFAEVSDKVSLVALPAAIYDAYEKVLPKRKEKFFGLEEVMETVTETTQGLFGRQEEGGEA